MAGSSTSEIARWLFDPSGLTPHGFCLLWEPWLIWTHALSNVAIGAAYFSIPLVLVRFVRRRPDVAFRPVFGLFAAFILLCGAGHWADLLTLWYPLYGVEGAIKAATAAVSVLTAVVLWPLLPKALALPSPAQMRIANAALRASEERHRANFVGAPVPLHILDTEGRIVEVSDRWLDLLGYAREQVVGRPFGDFQEDGGAATRSILPSVLTSGAELRDAPRRFVRRDGAVLDVLASSHVERAANGRPTRVIVALTDVTARKRAEAALAESERSFRLLVEGASDHAIYMLRPDGAVANWNPGARRIKGWAAEEIVGRHFSRFYTGEDRAAGAPGRALAAAARRGRYEAEGWRVRKDGSRFWASVVISALRDKDGTLVGFAKVTRDISEKREAERALSEARDREMFASAPAAMHALDAEGRITAVSDRWAEFMGYRREEVLGRHITEFLTEPGKGLFQARWPLYLMTDAIEDVQTSLVKRSGEAVEAIVSARVFRDADGAFLRSMSVITDITARLRAEEALRQAQKMEAIGQLTGGVAHDFNNVLQAVMGNLELIRRRLRDERPDVARLAANALEAAAKAAGLTSQLLAFARRQRLDPQPLDPAEVVEGMRALLARTAGARIALRVEAEERTGLCLADRNQLESALLNLAINARDAIGDAPGTITVSLRAERIEGASEGWPPPGEYVRIAVRDDGPGMPAEVRRRAFEPFFTTKAVGKGTGLGLAKIHGFAHQSGGTARIDSAPGKGTEVALLLPRTGAGVPEVEVRGAAEPEAGYGEAVLVVEDDALVRTALAETLRDLRYRVVEAADADAALALLDGGTKVAAVLTDLTMPGSMDGLGLAAAARARLSAVPVILITGHIGVLHGKALLPPGMEVMQKPHSRRAIAAALGRAFGRMPACA